MKITVREMCIFAMLGAVMYVSKILMEFAPNVHLLGMFIVSFTAVYRQKALYPIYVFVLLTGIMNGFAVWWIPYLYIWAVLWGMAMLVPRKGPAWIRIILYPVVCGLHGFMYGTIYAPAQALLFHYTWNTMLAWIIAGWPWDMVHGISNLICGSILIYPLRKILQLLKNRSEDNARIKEN